jgi:hypothetical protein
MVFQHPLWNPRVNLCYECVSKPGVVATEPYYPHTKIVPPKDVYRFPRVLKSQDELSAELDDLLADW